MVIISFPWLDAVPAAPQMTLTRPVQGLWPGSPPFFPQPWPPGQPNRPLLSGPAPKPCPQSTQLLKRRPGCCLFALEPSTVPWCKKNEAHPLLVYLHQSTFPGLYSVTLRWLQWKVSSEEAAKHSEKYFICLDDLESYTFIMLIVDNLENPECKEENSNHPYPTA